MEPALLGLCTAHPPGLGLMMALYACVERLTASEMLRETACFRSRLRGEKIKGDTSHIHKSTALSLHSGRSQQTDQWETTFTCVEALRIARKGTIYLPVLPNATSLCSFVGS